MTKSFSLLAIVILAWYGWHRYHAPLTYPPGVLIHDEPLQTSLAANDKPFAYGKFELTPLAHFALKARVLSRKAYNYDRQAALVPLDLAVGWGTMSDQAVLDKLSISQSMRFFWYEWHGAPPIAPDEIVCHATNLHLIPANSEIAARARSLPIGELIDLQGLLVEARGPELGLWRSSLSRTDTGNGACELVWVTELRPLYEAQPRVR